MFVKSVRPFLLSLLLSGLAFEASAVDVDLLEDRRSIAGWSNLCFEPPCETYSYSSSPSTPFESWSDAGDFFDQTSTVAPGSMTAEGSAVGAHSGSTDTGYLSSEFIFEIVFDLNEPAWVEILGSVSAFTDGTAEIFLAGPGGNVAGVGAYYEEFQTLDFSGLIDPGRYTVSAAMSQSTAPESPPTARHRMARPAQSFDSTALPVR